MPCALHAARLILVHNHPSGDPTPTPDDLHLTAEAVAAGRLLDIAVLDHVVLGHGTYVSLRDRGVAFDRVGARRRCVDTDRQGRRPTAAADADCRGRPPTRQPRTPRWSVGALAAAYTAARSR